MTKLQVGRFQLEEGAQLGAGGYGVVVKALDTQSGSIVAAKKIDKRKMKGDAIEREVMLMRMLNHPNVIAVLDQVEMDTTIFIFMELATKGELFGRVIQSGSLTEADARPYFTQLMNAVKFMHDKGVAHRDLKLVTLRTRVLHLANYSRHTPSVRACPPCSTLHPAFHSAPPTRLSSMFRIVGLAPSKRVAGATLS